MVGARSVVVALVLLPIFYASFDSGLVGTQPAPGGVTSALLIFALIFGVGAWATNATGDVKRSQMFAGVACATGLYGIGRLVLG